MKTVIVASQNPVKIDTTHQGFTKMFPGESIQVKGLDVVSGVSNQPMSDNETFQGAINRAHNARDAKPNADYWVGIEGGLNETDKGVECFAWIVIVSKSGQIGKGKTGSFFLPQMIIALVKQGKELGEADDIVFNRSNSKQKSGSVGILTDDIITRTSYYEQAVIFALIPFKNPELYQD